MAETRLQTAGESSESESESSQALAVRELEILVNKITEVNPMLRMG